MALGFHTDPQESNMVFRFSSSDDLVPLPHLSGLLSIPPGHSPSSVWHAHPLAESCPPTLGCQPQPVPAHPPHLGSSILSWGRGSSTYHHCPRPNQVLLPQFFRKCVPEPGLVAQKYNLTQLPCRLRQDDQVYGLSGLQPKNKASLEN